MNWLDRLNPQAGGAELHFFEIFRRLVEQGDEVTLVSSGFPGGAPRETVAGIEVHRFGGRHSFALHGRSAVRRELASAPYDVIVEDINKLPLYVANLTDMPCYVIVPHLFGTTAFAEASFPVAALVWLAERPIPRVYRRAAFHAISDSTRDDLVARGIRPEAIEVIYPGVDTTFYRPDPESRRAEVPTFLYVGRLKRYKGLETAIRAVARLRQQRPEAVLQVVGSGDDRGRLERLVRELGLHDSVRFLGFVSEEDKRSMLRAAWAVVFPSAKEGWGLVNVEAAACGTPAIAADSPGLRESVQDGRTGMIVPHADVEAWASAMASLAEQPERVETMGRQGVEFAASLTWEATARKTRQHLEVVSRSAKPLRGIEEPA